MKREKKNNQVLSALMMCVLAAGNIVFAQSGIWKSEVGNQLDISGMNAEAYQVDEVIVLHSGGYQIKSKSYGFQSDVELLITFPVTGDRIESVEIVSQGETDGIGSKIADEAFLIQFSGIEAPVVLKDKDMERNSVVKDEVLLEVTNENAYSHNQWNSTDRTPEAEAVRNLYGAGLLNSSIEGDPLTVAAADLLPEDRAVYDMIQSDLVTSDEFLPMNNLDQSAEGKSMRALYQAGLLDSSSKGQALGTPVADYPPEEAAIVKMQETGLLSSEIKEVAQVVQADVQAFEVDAVTGATVSSMAVVRAVDQAYLFLAEEALGK